ncbi:MAG: hypothetical protein PHE02_09395 [Lachnospiraceae bacterium]|nr:hypothetical protein [Lachnospiraceae bacterium]
MEGGGNPVNQISRMEEINKIKGRNGIEERKWTKGVEERKWTNGVEERNGTYERKGVEENKRNDYRTYHFQVKEKLFYGITGMGIVSVLGSVFYHSWMGVLLLLWILPLYMKQKGKELCEKRKNHISQQFKEAIMTVAVNLRAGYSIENAFRESYQDSVLLFGKESDICQELAVIIKGLHNNVNLEALLYDFGRRSDVDTIKDFAEIFQIAKRMGGDLNRIIQDTVTVICEKIQVNNEIMTLLSAKKYEQKIMNLIPIFIVLYIRTTSPGFFDPLYHNPLGVIVMSICLGLYGVAYYLAQKITDIKI